jgi:hypothetical protein
MDPNHRLLLAFSLSLTCCWPLLAQDPQPATEAAVAEIQVEPVVDEAIAAPARHDRPDRPPAHGLRQLHEGLRLGD